MQLARFQDPTSGPGRSAPVSPFVRSPKPKTLARRADIGWVLERVQTSAAAQQNTPLSPVLPVGDQVLGGGFGGYTCVGVGDRGAVECLVAGTYNGRVRWLDLETKVKRADVYCRPLGRCPVGGPSSFGGLSLPIPLSLPYPWPISLFLTMSELLHWKHLAGITLGGSSTFGAFCWVLHRTKMGIKSSLSVCNSTQERWGCVAGPRRPGQCGGNSGRNC
jgi:hypothetical protein